MEKYIPTIGDVVLYGGGTAPKVVVDRMRYITKRKKSQTGSHQKR